MKGLDISFSKPSQQWWEDRRAEGLEVMVQNLWTGGFASNKGIKAVAATNLKRARAAGLIIAAYANASPPDWWSIKIQMDNIKANAGAEWPNLVDFAVDVEIPRTNLARVTELSDALESEGKTADVLYTARWFWSGYMGNSLDPRWLRWDLWSAHYDWNPDIDFPSSSYGPWVLADLVGEQYTGTTNIEGQSIDLNNFIGDWPTGTQLPLPEEPDEPPVEEGLMGKILDLATAFGKAIEAEVAKAMKLPLPIKGDTGATGPAGKDATGGTVPRTYTVRSGDSLGTIAGKYSGVTWQQIYEANKSLIGSNPDLIQPGQVLVIP